MGIEGQVAIVTGASTGIGAAAARRLAADGAVVVLAARNQGAGEDVATGIRAEGGRARFVRTDVSVAAECEALISDVLRTETRIDVLVNNAGTLEIHGSVVETTEEAWAEALAVNLTSVFLCCKYVLPHMVAQGAGVIVNIGSISSVIGSPHAAAYNATKAGVAMLTRSIALDFGGLGIRANCVCPGAILSPTNVRQIEAQPDPASVYADLIEHHPIGHLGTPPEVADVIAFLAGPESRFMTGALVMVDGGYTAI